jgi:hypothetical protein
MCKGLQAWSGDGGVPQGWLAIKFLLPEVVVIIGLITVCSNERHTFGFERPSVYLVADG